MFGYSGKEKILDKARKLLSSGKSKKALEILQSSFTGGKDDLPLILEIMNIYHSNGKMREVVIWAKKGENISPEVKEHVIKEAEDLFYGGGKPPELTEYLIEKKAEKFNFNELYELVQDTDNEVLTKILSREENILKNIRKKENFSNRDKMHYYIATIINEKIDTEKAMNLLFELLEKSEEEENRIYEEIERINRALYGDPNILLALGKILLKRGKFERGIEQIRRAIEKSPEIIDKAVEILEIFKEKAPEIMSFLSDLYIKKGDREKALSLVSSFKGEEAIKKYELLSKQDPENLEILRGLAEANLRSKRFEEALRTYNNMIDIDPDSVKIGDIKVCLEDIKADADALFIAADIFKKLNDYDSAIDALNRSYTISPYSFDEILPVLNEILSLSKEKSIDGVILKAKILSKRNDVDGAIDEIMKFTPDEAEIDKVINILESISKEHPENTKPRILYYLLNSESQPERAINGIKDIIDENPESIPSVLKEIDGWIRKNNRFVPTAIKIYKSFKPDIFPPFVLPFAIAEAYMIEGNPEKAKPLYIKAINESPDRTDFVVKTLRKSYGENAENNLLIAEILVSLEKFDEAMELIISAVNQDESLRGKAITNLISLINEGKKNEPLYSTLLLLLSKGGYAEETIKYGKDAESFLPEDQKGSIYLNMAKSYSELGDISQAITYTKRAVGAEKKLLNDAINLMENLAEKNPDTPSIFVILSQLYKFSKEIKKSCEAIYHAYELNNNLIDKAIEEISSLIELSPIEAILYLRYGELLIVKGEHKGLRIIEKALKFDPSLKDEVLRALSLTKNTELDTSALILKARLLIQESSFDAAGENLIQLYKNYPEKRNSVLDLLTKIVDKVKITPENFREYIDVFYEEKRNRYILEFANRLVNSYPNITDELLEYLDSLYGEIYPTPLMILKGRLLKESGKIEESVQVFKSLFQKVPDAAKTIIPFLDEDTDDANLLLSDIFLYLGEIENAYKVIIKLPIQKRIVYLKKLIEREPKNNVFIRELGKLLLLTNKLDEARETLQQIDNPEEKDKALIWFAGGNIEVPLNKIPSYRESLLKEKLTLADSTEEKVEILVKLGAFEKAFPLIYSLPSEVKKKYLAKIYLSQGKFSNALDLLMNMKKEVDTLKMIYICSVRLGKHLLGTAALGLLENQGVVLPSAEKVNRHKYTVIKPIIRRS